MAQWRLLLAALLVALLCAGCGFQLRTWELGGNVDSVTITDSSRLTAVARDLERAFVQAGVLVNPQSAPDDANAQSASTIAPDAAPSADTETAKHLVLTLEQGQQDRRSISVTDAARAAEYQLQLGVNFSVRDGTGQTLIEPRWVRVLRVYRIDRNNLVGSNEEENLLLREMRNDVVLQIVRAINQVTSVTSAAEPT